MSGKVPKSITLITIPNGAHHVDLMFSSPHDTPDIKRARVIEKKEIKKWVDQFYAM